MPSPCLPSIYLRHPHQICHHLLNQHQGVTNNNRKIIFSFLVGFIFFFWVLKHLHIFNEFVSGSRTTLVVVVVISTFGVLLAIFVAGVCFWRMQRRSKCPIITEFNIIHLQCLEITCTWSRFKYFFWTTTYFCNCFFSLDIIFPWSN